MLEVVVTRVERIALPVARVAGGHDAEGADHRERARLGAAQRDVAFADPNPLALGAAGQVEIRREDIARIEGHALA